jgi:membrane-associated phospholipid phosphatase
MWALWPVRGIASLSIVMNVLMIAATPVIGAHYMIDVIGGILLAATSIMSAKYFLDVVAHHRSAQAASAKSWQIQLGLDAH